jgi:hypothetical protein
MVDLRLHVHPPADRHAGAVRTVVSGQIIGPQGAEVRVLQPRIAEAPEVPVVHVRVDESQHDVGVGSAYSSGLRRWKPHAGA